MWGRPEAWSTAAIGPPASAPRPLRQDSTVALGYARRSKESGIRTISLEDQGVRIAAYCQAQGWTLAEVLVDDGVSGGRRDRLQRIQEALRRHRAGVVVWLPPGSGRPGRRRPLGYAEGLVEAGCRAPRRRPGPDRGRDRHRLAHDRDRRTPEHYRRVISEKTRDALARLRANGRRVSRWAPYGFRFGPAGQLIAEPQEQSTLVEIADLRAGGLSLRRVSRALAERGVVARNGRPFAAKVLRGLVTNRTVGNTSTR